MPVPSVSDIIKFLEKIPEWVGLKRLLARIDELERRVAALEGRKPADKPTCLLCGGALRVTAEAPHPTGHVFGIKRLTLRCADCGAETTRDWDPAAKGV